jgi:hypothetical protein
MFATTTTTRTETDLIEAVDRIVSEIERAILDEDQPRADELHAVVTGGGASTGEREDRVLEIAWRLSAEDRLFRRAS